MAKKPAPKRKLITLSEGEKHYGMSRAVVAGDWCFVSGTVGYDLNKKEMPESVAQQTFNAFSNIQSALKAGGFELGQTVRVQYTVADKKDIPAILPVIQQHFGKILPAATMVVAGLISDDMKIEIEVTAFKG